MHFMKRKTIVMAVSIVALLTALIAASQPAYAGLTAVGPNNPADGFPFWYQDSTGLSLGQCLEGNNGFCILPAAGEEPNWNPALSTSFPGNYPSEYFYFIGETFAGPLFYRAVIEGAFASVDGSPAAGQQITFARIRLRADVDAVGSYTITHPYGTRTVNVPAIIPGPEINITEDIGVGAPGGPFDGALAGQLGPFLQSTTLTNKNVVDPITGNTYLSNPLTSVTVTGSPSNTNFVSIVGPGLNVTNDQFFISGKVMGFNVAPLSLAFPAQMPVVTSAPQTVTVTNISTVTTLILGQITVDTTDFAIQADVCSNQTIAALGACTFNVIFSSPTLAPPARTATVTIPAGSPAGIPAGHVA